MAKRTQQKARRRKTVATPENTARKGAPKKTTGKTAKRSTAKPAKSRATAGTTRAVQKKTAKKSASKGARKATPGAGIVGVALDRPAAPVAVPAAPVKRRSNLRKRDLAQFRELLLAKRAELIGDVSTLQSEALSKSRRDASGDLSSMPIHMADLGTDNYEKEFTLGLIEGSRALLREIDEALVRIESGTYGICEATGKPIGKARLRARPWAKFCYEYMLAQEKGRQESGM